MSYLRAHSSVLKEALGASSIQQRLADVIFRSTGLRWPYVCEALVVCYRLPIQWYWSFSHADHKTI